MITHEGGNLLNAEFRKMGKIELKRQIDIQSFSAAMQIVFNHKM